MNTPICDFLKKYKKKNALRLHMPGHKGKGFLGAEKFDITEIKGADSLYDADGIIKRSEDNASLIFGCPTYYSCEGSSLCIRAMIILGWLWAKKMGTEPLFWAVRNAHKTFVTAVALTDARVEWLYSENASSHLSCKISAEHLDRKLSNAKEKPVALYITSPDYLGSIQDIKEISDVCKRHSVLLLCDNAHGAYLKFLKKSLHPIDLGADLVCDSAHKTLPVLTGGAYLHISDNLPEFFKENAKKTLSFFGSTSPSYLILASLDKANEKLSKDFPSALLKTEKRVKILKDELTKKGFTLIGDECLKITIDASSYGYTGLEMGEYLEKRNIIPEFTDPDYLVLMLPFDMKMREIRRLKKALFSLEKRVAKEKFGVKQAVKEPCMSIKEAVFKESETILLDKSEGRVLANITVSCPPAVPIVLCGERIEKEDIEYMKYYNIKTVDVIKE